MGDPQSQKGTKKEWHSPKQLVSGISNFVAHNQQVDIFSSQITQFNRYSCDNFKTFSQVNLNTFSYQKAEVIALTPQAR